MEKLSAWILSIAGVVLLGVLLDVILPEGRTQKYIKSIFGIITVIVIIAPLPSFINQGFTFDFGSETASTSTVDDNYISEIYKRKIAVMETGLQNYLKDNGYSGTAVKIYVDSYTESMRITSVNIDTKKTVISEAKAHIDKYTEIKRLAAAFLNVGKEVLFLSG